ncbi:hypothetical protein D3C76_985200 [compost metagenome]
MTLVVCKFVAVDPQVLQTLTKRLEMTGVKMQMSHHYLQTEPLCYLLRGQTAQQTGQLTEIALCKQVTGTGFNDICGGFGIAGLNCMTHGIVQIAMAHQPAARVGVQFLLIRLRLTLQTDLQNAFQQWMQAIPGFTIVALEARHKKMSVLKSLQSRLDV